MTLSLYYKTLYKNINRQKSRDGKEKSRFGGILEGL